MGIPTVQDRLIQQALHRVLSAAFDREMSEQSWGFRPGRSAHDAVTAARGYVAEGKDWVVDIDLASFLDRCSYYPPADSRSSKRSGIALGTFILRPLRLPCETWIASSSPRLTRCNTV